MKRTLQSLAIVLALLAPRFTWSQGADNTLFIESVEASVNDDVILAGELYERLAAIAQARGLPSNAYQNSERERDIVIDRMINESLAYQEGVRQGFEYQQVELETKVTEELSAMRRGRQYEEAGGLEEAMKRLGRSMDSLRASLGRDIQRRHVVEMAYARNVDRKIEINDLDVERYQKEHPDEFAKNQKVEIRQIILLVPKDATAEQVTSIEQRAEAIYLQAKGGAPFLELVDKNSEYAGSKSTRGRLDPFSRGELLPEFDQAFDMAVGDVCKPFKTNIGFHIFRVEAKQEIEDYLRSLERIRLANEWLISMRSKAQIQVKGRGTGFQQKSASSQPAAATGEKEK